MSPLVGHSVRLREPSFWEVNPRNTNVLGSECVFVDIDRQDIGKSTPCHWFNMGHLASSISQLVSCASQPPLPLHCSLSSSHSFYTTKWVLIQQPFILFLFFSDCMTNDFIESPKSLPLPLPLPINTCRSYRKAWSWVYFIGRLDKMQARSHGGFWGWDEPPFFTDQKYKDRQWYPRLAAAHACRTGTVCTAAGL